MSRGLCEGSSLENISVGVAGEPQGDIAMKSTTSSPRHWAPPKGFWRVARPETLLLNSESPSTLAAPKDVPPTTEEGPKRKPKLKTVGVLFTRSCKGLTAWNVLFVGVAEGDCNSRSSWWAVEGRQLGDCVLQGRVFVYSRECRDEQDIPEQIPSWCHWDQYYHASRGTVSTTKGDTQR